MYCFNTLKNIFITFLTLWLMEWSPEIFSYLTLLLKKCADVATADCTICTSSELN